MKLTNWKKHALVTAAALVVIARSAAPGLAAGGSSSGSGSINPAASQAIKGWGCFPSYFRTDWDPVNHQYDMFTRTAIQDAVYNLGITFIRVDIEPRLYVSGTTVGDIVLDSTAVNDLVQQITIARNHGVTQYIMSCWSPPAVWKSAGSINGGSLIAADEQYFANYYVKVLQALNSRGVGLPLNISIQNEPDISARYDSCTYTVAQWQRVVKTMRATLNANGLSAVQIIGPENSSYQDDVTDLGGAGLAALDSDPALNSALGSYGMHGYGAGGWDVFSSGMTSHPKDAWTTEYSVLNYGSSEPGWTVGTFMTIIGCMTAMHNNYWCWWRGWNYGTAAPGDQDLISGDQTPIYSKRYWVMQKLFKSVPSGWVVHQITPTSGALIGYPSGRNIFTNMCAFEPAAGGRAVLLFSTSNAATPYTVSGVPGSTYTVYQTDPTHDMAVVGSGSIVNGSITLNIVGTSVTIVVTQ